MLSSRVAVLAVLAVLVGVAQCYPSYQKNVPNGAQVPHPCRANHQWKGLGHNNPGGGGTLNPFGKDLQAAGHKWTVELCQKDSDGDGLTNGQELGDPDCKWTKGSVPDSSSGLSHPGVCTPFTASKCQQRNKHLVENKVCDDDSFKCAAIDAERSTFNMTLRYTRTKIPNQVTNYFCQVFQLPAYMHNSSYHIVGNQPLIDNQEVMHHVLVYGCAGGPTNKELLQKPYKCGMGGGGVSGAPPCFSLIGVWGVGMPGQCFNKNAGILVGKGGFQYIMMQYHWNNVKMRSDMTDASAMLFHITPNLRPNNAQVLTLEQRYLSIPPGKDSYIEGANCSAKCSTGMLKKPMFITSSLLHMHYMGESGGVEHLRDGKVMERPLIADAPYSYDKPEDIQHETAIEFRPGDSMRLKCNFKSSNVKHTTYWGESTQDEMCMAFFLYYPDTAGMSYCGNFGELDPCQMNLDYGKNPAAGFNIQNCNLTDFLTNFYYKRGKPIIDELCDQTGGVCRLGCKQFIVDELNKQPCMKGWPKKYIELLSTQNIPYITESVLQLRLRTSACNAEIALDEWKRTQGGGGGGGGAAGGGSTAVVSVALYVVLGCVSALLLLVLVVGLSRELMLRKQRKVTPGAGVELVQKT